MDSIKKALEEFLNSKEFHSLEEANQALREFYEVSNQQPLNDFCGLSPDDMSNILYRPFHCPDVVSFNFEATPPVSAPLIYLLLLVLEGLKTPVKCTVTGNLPRKLCQEIYDEFSKRPDVEEFYYNSLPLRSEKDFWILHIARVIGELSGYIRKYKKRFSLTKKGQKVLEDGMTIEDYMHILKTYTRKFNWPYTYGGEPLNIIQDSFLFTIYLLKNYGTTFKKLSFYSERFITAFPMVLSEVPDQSDSKAKETISRTFCNRALVWFARNLGLAEIKSIGRYSVLEDEIRRTQFLDEFIQFHVPRSH